MVGMWRMWTTTARMTAIRTMTADMTWWRRRGVEYSMYQAVHCCSWHSATPWRFLHCFSLKEHTSMCVCVCVCDRKLPFKVHFGESLSQKRSGASFTCVLSEKKEQKSPLLAFPIFSWFVVWFLSSSPLGSLHACKQLLCEGSSSPFSPF